jgi:hypothetical protein
MTTRREFLLRTTAAGIVAAASFRIAHSLRATASEDERKVARAGVVETVLGPLDASKLGFTLTHEHVIRIVFVIVLSGVLGRARSEALQARGCSTADMRFYTGLLRPRAARRDCRAFQASRRCRPRRT